MTPSKLNTSEEQRRPKQKNNARLQKTNADSLARNDTQGTQTLPEQQNADRKRTSISAFKKTAPGTTTKPMTPARSKQNDLRKQKETKQDLFKRELKLIQNHDVYG